MIGRQLGHFRIVERIGSGGMGEVYRAHDEHLNRDVALKLLPAGRVHDESSRARFRREALALSRLNHPNIGTVHDFDRQDDIDFLVLEFVPGSSLAEWRGDRVLAEADLRHLGAQIARGLAAAHERGVVHRDLKPENVHVTPDRHVKILDFGVSKLVEGLTDTATELTETGSILGTVAYMAPEQLRGEAVDARADVYAAGTVLYEMATGRRPFAAASPAATMYAILNEPPAHPTGLNSTLSPDLEATILNALDKDPANRPSASALADALESGGATRAIRGRRSRGGTGAWWIAAGAVALVVALGVTLVRSRLLERWASGRADIESLAVLPLESRSLSAEQEYLVDGMTEELITGLAQVGTVRVISRASVMPYKNSAKPLREIARDLRVDAVVTGSVQWVGTRVQVRAELMRARTNEHLWGNHYERELGDVLVLQSEVVRAIVASLRGQLAPGVESRLPVARPVDPEAHKAYLRGRHQLYQYSQEGFQLALRHFQQSIELDPLFAPAHAGLSETYAQLASNWISPREAWPRARAAALEARNLDSTLSSAHGALATVYAFHDRNWPAAEAGFRKAIALNPSDPVVRQNYGYMLLLHRRLDEAGVQFDMAHELDPISPMAACMELWPLNPAHRFADVIPRARALLEAEPDLAPARLLLAQALTFSGDAASAVPEMEVAVRQMDIPLMRGWLGYTYARAGRRADAETIRASLMERSRTEYVQSYALVVVLVGLGRTEEAMHWLERGIDEGSEEVGFMKVDVALDPLRQHPRYPELLARLGFEP